MRLDLKEFAKAARSMHQQPGGVKRTRLMLHLRPYKTRKIFVLKATDGRTTLVTRVEHQGQMKHVEAIVSDFVAECTRLSVPVAGNAAAAAAPTSPAAAAAGGAAQKDGGAAGKNSQSATAGGQTSAAPPQQKQQPPPPQQQSSKQGNKGKKGKKH